VASGGGDGGGGDGGGGDGGGGDGGDDGVFSIATVVAAVVSAAAAGGGDDVVSADVCGFGDGAGGVRGVADDCVVMTAPPGHIKLAGEDHRTRSNLLVRIHQ
jgi:hypothetical protein